MLVFDTLWLLSDTVLSYRNVVWNTIDVLNGSSYIQYLPEGVRINPLSSGAKVSFISIKSLKPDTGSIHEFHMRVDTTYGERLIFSGNVIMGAGISRSVYSRNSLNLGIGGRVAGATVEGVISASDFRESYYIQDLEESYLRVFSEKENLSLEGGIFREGNFRIFGLRGRWGKLGMLVGYERAVYGRDEYVVEPSKRIYPFSDIFRDVVYGSVEIFVDGVRLKEGFRVDYDARQIIFDASYPLKKGSRLVIGYMYYSQGMRRDFAGFSYGRIRFLQREDRIRYVSDSLKNASAPGYFPTYYRDTVGGEYILQDSIFVYVGRGKGEYVVEFFPASSGDYEYQPDGDFYYFVGKGMGRYVPFKYMAPPSRERRLEYSDDFLSVSLVEENPNYMKYRQGVVDFEGRIERRWGDFSVVGVRKRSLLSPYLMPLNPLDATSGTFLSLDYRGFGVFFQDSVYGLMLKRDWMSAFLSRNGWMFRMDLSGGPFKVHGYGSSVKRSAGGDLYVGKEIYGILKVAYGDSTLDYAFGGGISMDKWKGYILYYLPDGRLSAGLDLSSPSLQGSFRYERISDVRYVDHFVYVGDGLGDYDYDPVSGRYYFHRGGRFNRIRIPVSTDSARYILQGNLSFQLGGFAGSMFISRRTLGFNMSSDRFYLSFNKWDEFMHGESYYSQGVFSLGIDYDTEYRFRIYFLRDVMFFRLGGGFYSSGVPFLMLHMTSPLSVKLEYRSEGVSPAYSKGLEISSVFSWSRYAGRVNIRLSGILIYRNGLLFKNLTADISQQF